MQSEAIVRGSNSAEDKTKGGALTEGMAREARLLENTILKIQKAVEPTLTSNEPPQVIHLSIHTDTDTDTAHALGACKGQFVIITRPRTPNEIATYGCQEPLGQMPTGFAYKIVSLQDGVTSGTWDVVIERES